jgi:hypothetical protein
MGLGPCTPARTKPGADGYCRSGNRYAHRVAWISAYGPIPDAMHVHHLCGNRACINPHHLSLMSARAHRRSHAAAITHCKRGHAFDEANTYTRADGSRKCRTCERKGGRQGGQ